MSTLWIIVTFAFVLGVLVVVAYALYEGSPFAHHAEQFRDARGRRRWESPHLETRDEYERRTHDSLT